MRGNGDEKAAVAVLAGGGPRSTAPSPAATAAIPPVVAAESLTIAYNGVVAVRDFSLAIQPGEIVGLIGEAACGKTTAALAMLGLLRPPGKLAGGTVRMDGRDLFTMKREDLRALRGKEVGLIVQSPRGALNPLLPIGQQIATVYRAHNDVSRKQADAHAIEMLRRVGINDPDRRYHAYPHEISGGMAQRVLIAIALSSHPRLLIADEPTSGLDVTIQADFLDRMWHTIRATGSAVLLVTQDLGVIANYCDRLLVMQDGRIVEEQRVPDFFRGPAHPYSRSILLMQAERGTGAIAGPSEDTPPLIFVRGLVKRYTLRQTKAVLQAVGGVFLEIRPGETLGLVGESGSGKTTVGRCILGLEKANEGELIYRGHPIDLRKGLPRSLRPKMQIVFQDPYDSLDPRWTVEDLLGEPLDLHTAFRGEAKRARIAELLDLVGLDQTASVSRPRSLSAGQQQRVGIARALACEPELIVLDEPTSALAPAARTAIILLLRSLQQKLGIAYLFISHDLATVKHLSHRVAVMYLSQIVEVGERDQIFNAPRHPYTRALLAAHLDTDPSRRRPEHPPKTRLEGEIPSPVDLPPGCYLAGRCPAAVARCRSEKQDLIRFEAGRMVRCWRAGDELLFREQTMRGPAA
jgi:oligopeptide/dipeptide ABC transporter ATP-binding protein